MKKELNEKVKITTEKNYWLDNGWTIKVKYISNKWKTCEL